VRRCPARDNVQTWAGISAASVSAIKSRMKNSCGVSRNWKGAFPRPRFHDLLAKLRRDRGILRESNVSFALFGAADEREGLSSVESNPRVRTRYLLRQVNSSLNLRRLHLATSRNGVSREEKRWKCNLANVRSIEDPVNRSEKGDEASPLPFRRHRLLIYPPSSSRN